ncbi:MAG TPA: hypothetical protein DD490_21730 [Acidobacteria bacterium]|nr:hypothetical protein [Acidobacteriota bacterium]
MDHPIPESLRRFATGASSRQENRVIVAHLLQGCARCARLVREGQRLPVAEEAYDGALSDLAGDRALRAAAGTLGRVLSFDPRPVPCAPSLPERSVASR